MISTLTTMPSQTASTSASRGTWAGRSATPSSAITPEPGDLGVVVDGQGPVGRQAHVELDPVGAQPPGLGEGVEGVLGEPLGATPMGEDGGHRARVTSASRFHRDGGRIFTKNSLPGRRRAVTLFCVNPLFTDGHLLGPIM